MSTAKQSRIIKSMYSIKRPTQNSSHYSEYLQLIYEEWSEKNKNDEFKDVPAPILLYLNESLIGGVTFTSYLYPEGNFNALWLNTLFIKPEFRGKKLSSFLMEEICKTIEQYKNCSLYVYTAIPRFYLKHGWESVSTQGEFSVLKAIKNM